MFFGSVIILAALNGAVLTIANKPPNVPLPIKQVADDNAYDDFRAAARLIPDPSDEEQPSPYSLHEDIEKIPLSRWKSVCEGCKPAFEKARSALNKEYLGPNEPDFTIVQFSELAKFREMARMFRSEAHYLALIGRHGAAVNSCLDAMEMAATIPNEGSSIYGLVGVAADAMVMREACDLVDSLSEREMSDAEKRLAGIESKNLGFSGVIRMEGVFCTASWQKYFQEPKAMSAANFGAFSRTWTGSGVPTSFVNPQYVRLLFVNKTKSIRDIQQYYENLALEAEKPYTGSSQAKPPIQNDIIFPVPEFEKARASFEADLTAIRLPRADIAIRRYRLKLGTPPASLKALVPAYLPNIPCIRSDLASR